MLIISQWLMWLLGGLLAIIGILLSVIWNQISNHLRTLSKDLGELKCEQFRIAEAILNIKERLERIEDLENKKN